MPMDQLWMRRGSSWHWSVMTWKPAAARSATLMPRCCTRAASTPRPRRSSRSWRCCLLTRGPPCPSRISCRGIRSPGRFTGHLPGQEGWLHCDLAEALAARASDLEAVLPAALGLATASNPFIYDRDLAPFVRLAFPQAPTERTVLTPPSGPSSPRSSPTGTSPSTKPSACCCSVRGGTRGCSAQRKDARHNG